MHLDICKKIIHYILIFLLFWTYTYFLSIMSSLFCNIGYMHLFSIIKSKTNVFIGHLLLLILHISIRLNLCRYYARVFFHMSIQVTFRGHYASAFSHMSMQCTFRGHYTFTFWHMSICLFSPATPSPFSFYVT